MTRHSIIGVVFGAVAFAVILALCIVIPMDRDRNQPAVVSTPTPAPAMWGTDKNALPGATLEFAGINLVEKSDSLPSDRHFTLEIPIQRPPKVTIDPLKVVVQVFLYDQTPDGTIIRTNASTTYRWSKLPVDWVKENIEVLNVDYGQLPARPGDADFGSHFYGYAADIYYKGNLQSTAAEPASMLKQFPLPQTLNQQ